MGTSYSKSNSIAVASLVALACASSSSVDAARPFSSTAFLPKTCRGSVPRSILQVRGGEESTIAPGETQNEKSLDEKVFAAMEKLGLSVPGDDDEVDENGCKNGVCPMPGQKTETKPPAMLATPPGPPTIPRAEIPSILPATPPGPTAAPAKLP